MVYVEYIENELMKNEGMFISCTNRNSTKTLT